jgi:hypothetical protein
MANARDIKKAATMVREEDLQDLQRFLGELKDRVHQSREDGRTFMMQQYVRLVAMVSPEVTRIQKRMEREDLAAFRKDHKHLKAEAQDGANDEA